MTIENTHPAPIGRPGVPDPVRVLLMIGSTRTDRFGTVPANWAAAQAGARADIEADVVDLAEFRLPTELMGNDGAIPDSSDVAELGKRIGAADAVVIVTPVYNRGYPASLKNAIDWFGEEWSATPVGFVSYGGRTGGVEAVEQLRTVFVELGTMTIRNVLSFPNFWESFDENGALRDPGGNDAAAEFYDQLTWWAGALRDAKTKQAV